MEIQYQRLTFNMGINSGKLFLQIISNNKIVDNFEREIPEVNLGSILYSIFTMFPLSLVNGPYLAAHRDIKIHDGEIMSRASVTSPCQKLSDIEQDLPNILLGILPLC